jgi:hypothetical protein
MIFTSRDAHGERSLPRIEIGGEAMMKFVSNAFAAMEKALFLSEFASECRDPEKLRETALAIIRDQRAEKNVLRPEDGQAAPPRIAA